MLSSNGCTSCLIKGMADNTRNEHSAWNSSDDEVHPRSRLSSDEREKDYLWNLYSDGANLSRNCIVEILDAIKVLYDSEVADRVEVEFTPLLHDERAVKITGLMIGLQNDYPSAPPFKYGTYFG